MSRRATSTTEDVLFIVDDTEVTKPTYTARPWRILVVDDDREVHETTRFGLRGTKILGRDIELLHAYSAVEALQIARSTPDIAVSLIDVVMETPDAGLKLVHALRQEGFGEMRIVLRTGQPGYAPEVSVIEEYEIDDYRTKSELTHRRLTTVITAGVRAFEQLCSMSHHRAGLEVIIESATNLLKRTNLELFAQGILIQIAGLCGVEANGIVTLHEADEALSKGRVVSGVGRFVRHAGASIEDCVGPRVWECLRNAQNTTEPVFVDNHIVLHFCSVSKRSLFVVIDADKIIPESDLDLIRLFSTNIGVGFENWGLVERLDRLAHIDPVLGVPNANAFEQLLADYSGGSREMHIGYISIDSIDATIAMHGMKFAIQVLRNAYDSLVENGGPELHIARVGDHAFALLGTPAVLNEALIASVFHGVDTIDDVEVATLVTCVIFEVPTHSFDPAALLGTASTALLHIQQTRQGQCVFFDASMCAEVDRRMHLQGSLLRDMALGQGLSVYLQPKVNLDSGNVTGAEALLRWNLDGEEISPSEFIPIAESVGLIHGLTRLVVQSVGRWSRSRSTAHPVPVAINLSMADLNCPGFAEKLLTQVASAGLDSSHVEFEVTEGVAMENVPWASVQVRSLQAAGFVIALDDFGTGYSSLGSFERLPVEILKIDRSFVNKLEVASARSSLAAVVLGMAQTLGVQCVAEGIETTEQRQALSFLGCKYGQGYFFGRPVPIESFEDNFLQKIRL